MSGFRKFEFDNFIIEDQEEPVIEAASSPDPESFEDSAPEAVELHEPPVIIEAPARTYSEEEFENAKLIAEQSGYEKGYQAKSSEAETGINGLLENINAKLLDLISQRESLDRKLEQDFINLNREVIKKLIPTLIEDQAVGILNQFLAENFSQIRKSPKLSFYFNPEIIKEIQDQIARLAHSHDFEGKISIHKDPALGLADCRIEWENGGVERNSGELLARIDNLLEKDAEAESNISGDATREE